MKRSYLETIIAWTSPNHRTSDGQDAKARFSKLLDACLSDGPRIVTRRGTETAVLVPLEEWHRGSTGSPASVKRVAPFRQRTGERPHAEKGPGEAPQVEALGLAMFLLDTNVVSEL